jgi:hypothetical protein
MFPPHQEDSSKIRTPKRLLAYRRIRDLILSGRFAQVGCLPSIRKTAKLVALNRDAIWRAYADLEKDGYIKSAGNRKYHIHPALATTHLRTLEVHLITVGEDSIRFSGLQRFYKTLVDNEALFGIRTRLKCVMRASEIQAEWLQGIDCLIVGGYFEDSKTLDSLTSSVPSIGIITSPDWKPNCAIDTDNAQLGKLAAKRLIECGSKKPCLISYSNSDSRHTLRKLGFQAEWIEGGRRLDDISEIWISPKNIYKRVTELELKARNLRDHDAVFCLEKESAIDLLSILEHLNIRVPETIRVISADGTFEGLKTKPKLTYVKQNFETMASIAATRVREMWASPKDWDPKQATEKVLVPSEVVIRESA